MTERVWMLQYDIPKVRNARGLMVDITPNPSDELWAARCVRTTGSVWLCLESDLPRTYLTQNRLRQAGCVLFVVPYDVSGADTLRSMALHGIQTEVTARMRAVEETRAAAESRLDDESEPDFRKRRRALLAAANRIAREVATALRNMERAAQRFGIDPKTCGVAGAANAVTLIADDMKSRAAAFADANGILTRRGGEGSLLARGMRSGEVPADIAADWLRDNGEWDAGERLGSAFQPLF